MKKRRKKPVRGGVIVRSLESNKIVLDVKKEAIPELREYLREVAAQSTDLLYRSMVNAIASGLEQAEAGARYVRAPFGYRPIVEIDWLEQSEGRAVGEMYTNVEPLKRLRFTVTASEPDEQGRPRSKCSLDCKPEDWPYLKPLWDDFRANTPQLWER